MVVSKYASGCLCGVEAVRVTLSADKVSRASVLLANSDVPVVATNSSLSLGVGSARPSFSVAEPEA